MGPTKSFMVTIALKNVDPQLVGLHKIRNDSSLLYGDIIILLFKFY